MIQSIYSLYCLAILISLQTFLLSSICADCLIRNSDFEQDEDIFPFFLWFFSCLNIIIWLLVTSPDEAFPSLWLRKGTTGVTICQAASHILLPVDFLSGRMFLGSHPNWGVISLCFIPAERSCRSHEQIDGMTIYLIFVFLKSRLKTKNLFDRKTKVRRVSNIDTVFIFILFFLLLNDDESVAICAR